MELYVVLDTKGDGRVLGVFDDLAMAERIVAENPWYYKLHRCRLNELNPEVLGWIDTSEKRESLQHIMQRMRAGQAR